MYCSNTQQRVRLVALQWHSSGSEVRLGLLILVIPDIIAILWNRLEGLDPSPIHRDETDFQRFIATWPTDLSLREREGVGERLY